MRVLTLSVCVVVICLVSVAPADDGLQPGDASHESRQKFAHTVAVWTQSRIRDYEGMLAYQKRELAAGLKRRPPISHEARTACEAEIKKIEGDIFDLKGKSGFCEPILPYELKVGSVGKIAGTDVRVVEVIDAETAVIEGAVGAVREKPAGAVVKEPTWKPNSMMVVIQGVSTAGMRVGELVDPDLISSPGPNGTRIAKYFEVDEKRQFKLPSGENTTVFFLSKMSGLNHGEPSVTAMIGIEREKLSPPKKKPTVSN